MKRIYLAIASTLLALAIAPSSLAQSRPAPPMAGYVCADFATQPEAQWHYLQGTAPLDLDADGDGTACEELPIEIQRDGHRTSGTRFTNGSGYSLMYSSTGRYYYLSVFGYGEPFVTRIFSGSEEAFAHADCYYGNGCSIRR